MDTPSTNPSTTMNDQSKGNSGPASRSGAWAGIVICALICATIGFISYLIIAPRVAPMRRLWVPYVVDTNGVATPLSETRQLEFWTPSARTKDYLRKTGAESDEKEKWQAIPSDDVVRQFGMVLHSNRNVFGYRRVEELGQGQTTYKPGWWWTMTVTTNYSAADLARVYQDFWKSHQVVRVEVVDNRGSDVK